MLPHPASSSPPGLPILPLPALGPSSSASPCCLPTAHHPRRPWGCLSPGRTLRHGEGGISELGCFRQPLPRSAPRLQPPPGQSSRPLAHFVCLNEPRRQLRVTLRPNCVLVLLLPLKVGVTSGSSNFSETQVPPLKKKKKKKRGNTIRLNQLL